MAGPVPDAGWKRGAPRVIGWRVRDQIDRSACTGKGVTGVRKCLRRLIGLKRV